ncbi:MAG: ABC transporter ATP-binding protein [Phycisphaerae bacterium]
MSPAIRVENLGKRYKIGLREQANQNFREVLSGLAAAPFRRLRGLRENTNGADTIWALKDVSFDVQPGEVVGIIGRNGAGKTTLLKILSRITEPTSGRVELRGRVASLLEVGTGFHPELTGRENIYLNGAILGMKKAEIDRKFDEIVAFAETEKFLDTPVKRYSSGMYVRLAFAVAAHLEPDILIVDEVLAVGDAEFQRKCVGKMKDVATGGRTVLFVSHNMAAITHLCGRVVLIEKGTIVADGDPKECIERFILPSHRLPNSREVSVASHRPPGYFDYIDHVRTLTGNGDPSHDFSMGATIVFEMAFSCKKRESLRAPVMGVVLNHPTQGIIAGVNTRMTEFNASGPCNSGRILARLHNLRLLPGRYSADIWLGDGLDDIDTLTGIAQFTVHSADVYGTGKSPISHMGLVYIDADWHFDVTGPLLEPSR